MTEAHLPEAIRTAMTEVDDALGDNDRAFIGRVFATPAEVYEDRLRAVGFLPAPSSEARVLDAGCGFGQWTRALSTSWRHIVALDVAPHRVHVAQRAAGPAAHVEPVVGSVSALELDDDSVDAVWCYGVLNAVDWRRTFSEFVRVLRPGGRLMATGNGLGWYVHMWRHQPNATRDHRPRQVAAAAFDETVRVEQGEPRQEGRAVIIERDEVRAHLESLGANVIALGDEGTTQLQPGKPAPRAFFEGTYAGLPGCFEVIAEVP